MKAIAFRLYQADVFEFYLILCKNKVEHKQINDKKN